MDNDTKTTVLKKLNAMDEIERMELIDKYCQHTKDVYRNLSPQEYIDISLDIFLLRSSKDDLVASYVNENPVIDHPGCMLHEFLNKEMEN